MRKTLFIGAAASLAALAIGGCALDDSDLVIDPNAEYVAQFNEPFLSFRSDGNSVTVTSPEDMDGTKTHVSRSDFDGAASFEGTIDGNVFVLGIERGECFDDMSGLPFSHRATLTGFADSRELTGCARLTTEPQPRE